MFNTGDLARYLPDGTIECLGRIDHQVKIRGYRIELGEIETTLAQHPAVRNNVVVARKDEAGADYLTAYVIPRDGQPSSADTLRGFLKQTLPEYMVPTHFVVLDKFPLTPNGKIDRKALPAPAGGQPRGGARTIVAPRTDAERALAAVWEEVLKVKPISMTDNFFDLGGHSFLAAVLMAKIRTQLGHALPLGALFAAPTVEKLSAVLEKNLEAGSDSSLVPFQEDGANPPLFLIAGVGGHVFTFHKFARMLGPEQPAYGVKAVGIDGKEEPPDNIEEIAAHYVKEITALRPKGPYMLGGFSIGALVALELTQQLRALGHAVPLLVVFDMNAPGYPKKLPLPQRLLRHVSHFARLGFQEKKAYLLQRYGNVKARVLHRLGLAEMIAPEIPGVEALSQAAMKRVWANLMLAGQRYWPKGKIDSKVLVIKAEHGLTWAAAVFDDPKLGWGQWTTGGIDTCTIPGGHQEIFHDDHINQVADALKESVARTIEGERGVSTPRGSE